MTKLLPLNVCEHCTIPDQPGFGNPEYENDFSCSDCACYSCEFRTNCDAQCSPDYPN